MLSPVWLALESEQRFHSIWKVQQLRSFALSRVIPAISFIACLALAPSLKALEVGTSASSDRGALALQQPIERFEASQRWLKGPNDTFVRVLYSGNRQAGAMFLSCRREHSRENISEKLPKLILMIDFNPKLNTFKETTSGYISDATASDRIPVNFDESKISSVINDKISLNNINNSDQLVVWSNSGSRLININIDKSIDEMLNKMRTKDNKELLFVNSLNHYVQDCDAEAVAGGSQTFAACRPKGDLSNVGEIYKQFLIMRQAADMCTDSVGDYEDLSNEFGKMSNDAKSVLESAGADGRAKIFAAEDAVKSAGIFMELQIKGNARVATKTCEGLKLQLSMAKASVCQ